MRNLNRYLNSLLPFVRLSFCASLIGLSIIDKACADDEAGGGFNSVRVENEYKIVVPGELTEQVWDYLVQRYGSTDSSALKESGLPFTSTLSDEDFQDVYFDTFGLKLAEENAGVRHRTRIVSSDPSNRKNGRELIQIKLSRAGDNDTNRSEIKFPVRKTEIASEGRMSKDPLDRHQLLGLMAHSARKGFVKTISSAGVDARALSEKVVLNQRRRRVYVLLNGAPYATMTLDEVSSSKWWSHIAFTELELELNEIKFTAAGSQERISMQKINDSIKEHLLSTFPALRVDQTPKYTKAINVLKKKYLFLPLALYIGLPIEAVGGVALFFLIVVGLFTLLRRRQALGTTSGRTGSETSTSEFGTSEFVDEPLRRSHAG